jgi:hypothetical protein
VGFTLWALLWDPHLEPPLRPTSDRKKMVERYFRPPADKALKADARRLGFLALAAVVLALIVASALSIVIGVVLLLIAAGLWTNGEGQLSRYRKDVDASLPKPTDQQMDKFLEADCAMARIQALKRMDLTLADLDLGYQPDPDEHPLVVHGPVFDKQGPVVGDDGKWRFRTNEMMVICPTAHHLGIFECRIDVSSGKCRKEEVREVYYSDVVMVAQVDKVQELKFDALNLNGTVNSFVGGKLSDLTELQIALPSADRCEILVAMGAHHSSSKSFRLQVSNIDHVLPELRNLLRTHK